MAGGRLSWMEIISVFFVCAVRCDYIYLIASGREELVWSVVGGAGEETRGLAGGDEIGHQTNGVLRVFGWEGTEGLGWGGASFSGSVCTAAFFAYGFRLLFVFLIQELVMPFSLSLLPTTALTNTAAASPIQIHPPQREEEDRREMDRYLPSSRQVRSGQVKSGRGSRTKGGRNIWYLVVVAIACMQGCDRSIDWVGVANAQQHTTDTTQNTTRRMMICGCERGGEARMGSKQAKFEYTTHERWRSAVVVVANLERTGFIWLLHSAAGGVCCFLGRIDTPAGFLRPPPPPHPRGRDGYLLDRPALPADLSAFFLPTALSMLACLGRSTFHGIYIPMRTPTPPGSMV